MNRGAARMHGSRLAAFRQWGGVALGLLALFVALGGQVFAHGGDTSLVHGCIKINETSNANVIVVGPTDSCPEGYTAQDWQISGTPGPDSILSSHIKNGEVKSLDIATGAIDLSKMQ